MNWKTGALIASFVGLMALGITCVWNVDWDANDVREFRVMHGEVVSQSELGVPHLRLESGDIVAGRAPGCTLEPGERYTLERRTQNDGDTTYVVVCVDQACERVSPCGYTAP